MVYFTKQYQRINLVTLYEQFIESQREEAHTNCCASRDNILGIEKPMTIEVNKRFNTLQAQVSALKAKDTPIRKVNAALPFAELEGVISEVA
jgi:hypothetical protein